MHELAILALVVIPYFDINLKREAFWQSNRRTRLAGMWAAVMALSLVLLLTGNLLSGAPLASGGEIRSGTSIDQVLADYPYLEREDIFAALTHQDPLQRLYTGGTVFHGFLGERLEDWKSARLLVRRIAENFHLPYFTISPTFTICPVHGYISGEHFECPHHQAA